MTNDKYKNGFLRAEADCRELEAKIQVLQKKLDCSIEAHLIESIISLFNQGVLVRRLKSPRMSIDKNNFTMSVEQAQSVTFEGRDKIIQLQAESTELQRKLDLAVEALKFYGNSSNYESHDISRTDGLPCYDILCFDFTRNVRGKHLAGKRARQALKEIGEER